MTNSTEKAPDAVVLRDDQLHPAIINVCTEVRLAATVSQIHTRQSHVKSTVLQVLQWRRHGTLPNLNLRVEPPLNNAKQSLCWSNDVAASSSLAG